MKIIKITDRPDGSAILDIEMTNEEKNFLINYGFNHLIKEQIKKMNEAEKIDE